MTYRAKCAGKRLHRDARIQKQAWRSACRIFAGMRHEEIVSAARILANMAIAHRRMRKLFVPMFRPSVERRLLAGIRVRSYESSGGSGSSGPSSSGSSA